MDNRPVYEVALRAGESAFLIRVGGREDRVDPFRRQYFRPIIIRPEPDGWGIQGRDALTGTPLGSAATREELIETCMPKLQELAAAEARNRIDHVISEVESMDLP